jgi:hypothetical protein
MEKELDK